MSCCKVPDSLEKGRSVSRVLIGKQQIFQSEAVPAQNSSALRVRCPVGVSSARRPRNGTAAAGASCTARLEEHARWSAQSPGNVLRLPGGAAAAPGSHILGHSIGVRLNYSSQKAPCFLQHQAGDGPALSPAWRQSSVCF